MALASVTSHPRSFYVVHNVFVRDVQVRMTKTVRHHEIFLLLKHHQFLSLPSGKVFVVLVQVISPCLYPTLYGLLTMKVTNVGKSTWEAWLQCPYFCSRKIMKYFGFHAGLHSFKIFIPLDERTENYLQDSRKSLICLHGYTEKSLTFLMTIFTRLLFVAGIPGRRCILPSRQQL